MREAISRVIRSLFTRNRGEIETMMKMSRNDRWRSSLVFFFLLIRTSISLIFAYSYQLLVWPDFFYEIFKELNIPSISP